MDGRAFLDIARELVRGTTEAHRRSAAGRAYYALMLEVRDRLARWGFSCPPRDKVHHFARHRLLVPNDADLNDAARALDELSRLRNAADYELSSPGQFATDSRAQAAIRRAATAITTLDTIDADAARRAVAIAAIRSVFP
jgi:hypothetical protein